MLPVATLNASLADEDSGSTHSGPETRRRCGFHATSASEGRLKEENGNHMNGKRILAGSAVLVAGALVLSACAGGGSDGGSGDGDVTMTFWHNSTTGAGKAFWDDTVAAFEEANPGVKIEMQSVQNEEMDGKLQTALNSGDAPDIFMQRGGGKIADDGRRRSGHGSDERDHRRHQESALGRRRCRAFEIDGKVYGDADRPCCPAASSTAGTRSRPRASARRRPRSTSSRPSMRPSKRPGIAPDRRRREGCLAGRSLVLLLRPARVQPEGDDGRSRR